MRNGQNKHRMRGRNRGGSGGGGGGKNHNPLTRVYESNGPDVKIRGTANHIAEKYIQLARDATTSGDPVAAENYYQHAEHYFRLIAAAQEQFRQSQPFQQRSEGANEESFDEGDEQPGFGNMEPHSPREHQQREAQPYQQREQPYPRDFQQGEHQPRQERQERQERQPREHRPRHDRQRDNRRDEGLQEGRQRDNQLNDNRQSQDEGRQFESRQPAQSNGGESDIDRLPSFITGAPAQSAAQNGEGSADRFPLNRRRRRPRAPRGELAGSTEGADDGAASAGE